jgi:D-alanyl-D-alanine carboxypeptidase
VKGFKTKKEHEIASLTKVMTFYCAYIVVIKYYLIVDKLELLVDREAEIMMGTKANLLKDELVTLQDLLYGLMLNSGNDAAHVITRNLGAMISKKNRGEYFSPYDIRSEPAKDEYLKMFVCLMNSAAKELKMNQTRFYNSHGMVDNVSTVRDLAKVTYECLKIPLFCKVVATKKHLGKARFVNSLGQVELRQLQFTNTNKLLQNPCYKGVKTGYSQQSGGI